MKDLETKKLRLRKAIADLTLDKLILQEASREDVSSPARRRALGEHRSTQRKVPWGRDDERR